MDISLIIPCYNEELNIQKGVLDRIGNYIQKHDIFKEVIIIDDGSSDKSKEIIKDSYLSQFSKFRLIENRHQGKAVAVMTGIKEATSSHVIFADMDLATPLEESRKIIEHFQKGHNIAIGSRASRREGAPFERKLQSFGFTLIRNLIIGLGNIKDTQCGFKGFKKDTAQRIIDRMKVFTLKHKVKDASVSAGFDLEFLFIAKKLGYTIYEVPIEWRHAETKRVSFFKDSLETITDMIKIRLNDIGGKYS